MLKKLTKHAMALAALAIAAVSYTLMSFGNKDIDRLDEGWFELISDTANPQEESSYQPASGGEPDECEDGTAICAVFGMDNGQGQPQLTTELQSQIAQALSEGESSSNVRVKAP